ncbi:YbjN domain-containing protein [Tumidithrix elongata RA019]|uniref:YbjN domain-containing protein n=1 Tax=Tumidithrix elongata BACA0141 TaxID=2716417 RepID=A0AAW9Q089_9CYAN|nr:YbjN domain-containing protein [Tumidithrix elongata RA019]
MSDFETLDIHIIKSNLTFLDPQKVPLNLQILELTLTRQEDEVLECRLTLQVSPEIYQRIDVDSLFNLNPEFRIPFPQKTLALDRNIVLQVSLQPDLFPELAANVAYVDELGGFLEHLSQNEPSNPFLFTENWLGLSVTQGVEPDIYGYRSIWAYIKPSDMSEEALKNGQMTEVMNQFIEEQVKTNFANLSFGGNSEIQSEVLDFMKQLVGKGSIYQTDQSFKKSNKQKKSQSSRFDFQSEITGLIKQLIDTGLPQEEEVDSPSSQLFEILVEFFQQDNWDFAQTEGETVLRTMFQGENGQWSCYAWVLEERKRMAFYSICPVNVPEERKQYLAELITRCNYCLLMGNFEMDFLDGEIRFKTSIDVNGDRLTFALLRQLIYTNVLTMDRYLPAIMAVIYGDVSPQQAIAEIEQRI